MSFLSFAPYFVQIARRKNPELIPEMLPEILGIIVTHLEGNLRDIKLALLKQQGRPFHPESL